MRIAHLLAVTALLVLGGCQTNAATGRSQFLGMSRDEGISLGEQSMPGLIEEYGGQVGSDELMSYVELLGDRLAAQTEADYPSLPWDFTVLDSDVINAFALPGGKVFVTRGLLVRLDNEAQLAGVIGHEIGHVSGEHASERVGQQMIVRGIQIGAIATAGATQEDWAIATAIAVGAGGQGYLLKFGRDQEIEADTLGVRYMTLAGYDPEAMLEVLAVLQSAASGPRSPEFLSTHPHPRTRLRTVSKLLAGEYAFTQGDPAYRKYRDRYHREALPFLGEIPAVAVLDPATRDGQSAGEGSRRALGGSMMAWCGLCRPAGSGR